MRSRERWTESNDLYWQLVANAWESWGRSTSLPNSRCRSPADALRDGRHVTNAGSTECVAEVDGSSGDIAARVTALSTPERVKWTIGWSPARQWRHARSEHSGTSPEGRTVNVHFQVANFAGSTRGDTDVSLPGCKLCWLDSGRHRCPACGDRPLCRYCLQPWVHDRTPETDSLGGDRHTTDVL